MKLREYFREFLVNTVNLSDSKLDELNARVDAIDGALNNDGTLGGKMIDKIPQGSWAHETIIKPGDGLEFDADFLVQIEEDPDWNLDPQKYANAVWNCLSNHGTYGTMSRRKDRCVRVTYAESSRCHIDVVPYVVLSDGRGMIVNRSANAFEETNPAGFTEWLHDKDKIANRNLRRVIRLLKYLRDHCGAFQLKSVLLTTLLGERVESWRTAVDPDHYKDIPTTLVNVLEDLDAFLQSHWTKPYLVDPSCPSTSFDHRWTQAQYEAFKDKIHKLTAKARAAYDDEDKATSLEKWQDIFGSEFKSPTSLSKILTASAATPPTRQSAHDRAPREQFIGEHNPVAISHFVEIDCQITPTRHPNRAARRLALRSRAGRVAKHNDLLFRVVRTDVAEPFTTRWKIRNHGAEAARVNALRGEIHPDNRGHHERFERTAYVGHHYVECYIIKDGTCVAWTRQDVIIAAE